MSTQPTCEERIDDALKDRLEWFDQLEYRIDHEGAWSEDDLMEMDYYELVEIAGEIGELPWKKGSDGRYRRVRSRADLVQHVIDMTEDPRQSKWEAPLSISAKTVVTVQMSWGGPSDEFDVEVDEDGDIGSITYRFKDWFDGAKRELSGSRYDSAAAFLAEFVELRVQQMKETHVPGGVW